MSRLLAGREGSRGDAFLCSGAVLDPLYRVLLPHMAAADLGRLACTCRDLRFAVEGAPPSSWQGAVAASLPQPTSSGCWPEARALLSRYSTAKRNIQRNQGCRTVRLAARKEDVICGPAYSADGSLVCIVTVPQGKQDMQDAAVTDGSIVTVLQVHTGQANHLALPCRPCACIFAQTGDAMYFVSASTEPPRPTAAPHVQAEVHVCCQMVGVKEQGLELLSTSQSYFDATVEERLGPLILASFAPGGRFLAIFPSESVDTVHLMDRVSMRHLACIPHVSCANLPLGIAWSSDGSRLVLTTLHGYLGGELIAFDLVRGLKTVLSIDSGLAQWEDATWQGDELVARDRCKTLFRFSQPFSPVQEQGVRLLCQADGWFSPCGTLAVHTMICHNGSRYDMSQRPKIVQLCDGGLVCNLHVDCMWRYICTCSWSPDSAFLAIAPRAALGSNICCFYNTRTGAAVLQGLIKLKRVSRVDWAPDCCSVAITHYSKSGQHEHVCLVRLAS